MMGPLLECDCGDSELRHVYYERRRMRRNKFKLIPAFYCIHCGKLWKLTKWEAVTEAISEHEKPVEKP